MFLLKKILTTLVKAIIDDSDTKKIDSFISQLKIKLNKI